MGSGEEERRENTFVRVISVQTCTSVQHKPAHTCSHRTWQGRACRADQEVRRCTRNSEVIAPPAVTSALPPNLTAASLVIPLHSSASITSSITATLSTHSDVHHGILTEGGTRGGAGRGETEPRLTRVVPGGGWAYSLQMSTVLLRHK